MTAISTTPSSSSVIPAGLAATLPNPKTPWLISPDLFARIQKQGSDSSKAFVACPVVQTDPEYNFVLKYFLDQKPKDYGIKRILCIHNAAHTKSFEGGLQSMEVGAKNFPPGWREEEPKQERAATIKRWEAQTAQFSPVQLASSKRIEVVVSAKVLPLWHGTRHVESICASGFTFFGKHHFKNASAKAGANASTDIGYFGNGIYLTNSAHYASMYNAGNLLLTWVSMREPYPVVSDIPIPKKGSDMIKLEGQSAYQNYNAHYIPVTSTDPKDPENMVYHPCSKYEKPAWDEYVVAQSAQTLARFWVELTADGVPNSLGVPLETIESLSSKIFELLEIPQIKEDNELSAFLFGKVDILIDQNPKNTLSTQDQEFFKWAKQLLDSAGKVRNVVKQKLMQKSTGSQQEKLESKVSFCEDKPSPPSSTPIIATSPTAGSVISPAKKIEIVNLSPPKLPTRAFGKGQWAHYFGDVGDEPPLPSNIHEILKSRCVIWPDNIIEQTHMLTLIPKTLEGKPLTLNSLGELVSKHGFKKFYNGSLSYNRILKEHGNTPVYKSYWVLMPNIVIPESRNKCYEVQKQLIETYNQKFKVEYQVPTLIEAAVSISMQKTYGGRSYYDLETYTRCQEQVGGFQTAIGGDSSDGLIFYHQPDGNSTGLAPVWKF